MDRKLEDRCAREFENEVASTIEELFALLQAKCPEEIHEIEIPIIGGGYDPHEPHGELATLVNEALATRALCKQHWAPTYPPLPLADEDIEEMQNETDKNLMLWGICAAQLRDLGWELRRMDIFHEYCEGRRRAGHGAGLK